MALAGGHDAGGFGLQMTAFGGVAPAALVGTHDSRRQPASLDAVLDAEIMQLLVRCGVPLSQARLTQVVNAGGEPASMLGDLVTADSLGLSSSCSSQRGAQQLGGQLAAAPDALSPAQASWPPTSAPPPPALQTQRMQQQALQAQLMHYMHAQPPQAQHQYMQLQQAPLQPMSQAQLHSAPQMQLRPQPVQLHVPPAALPSMQQAQQQQQHQHQPASAVAVAAATASSQPQAGATASAEHSGQQSPSSGAKRKAPPQKLNYKEARKRTRDRHVVAIESLQQQLRTSDQNQEALKAHVEALQASKVQLLARLSDLTSRWQETVAKNADLHRRNILLEQRLAAAGGCCDSDSRDDTTAAASSQGQVINA